MCKPWYRIYISVFVNQITVLLYSSDTVFVWVCVSKDGELGPRPAKSFETLLTTANDDAMQIFIFEQWDQTRQNICLGKPTVIPAHLLIKCWRRIIYIVKLLSDLTTLQRTVDKSLTIYNILLQHFIKRWAGISVAFPRMGILPVLCHFLTNEIMHCIIIWLFN